MSNEYQQDELIGIVSRALSAYAFAVRGGYKGTMEDFSRKLAALLNEGVTASVDPSTHAITLSGPLEGGTYTAYFEVQNDDGTKSLLEIGELTLGEEETTEPVTYTVTFVADGVTVADVTYEAGETSIEEPAVPAKDGYTGAWEPYTLNDTNITVNAVYTAIAPTVNNLLDTAGYKSGYRIKTSTGQEDAVSGVCCTGFMPITRGDTLYIKGITTHSTANYNVIAFFDNAGNVISSTTLVSDNTDCNNGVYSTSPNRLAASTDAIAQFRFSCATITDDTIVTVNEEIE